MSFISELYREQDGSCVVFINLYQFSAPCNSGQRLLDTFQAAAIPLFICLDLLDDEYDDDSEEEDDDDDFEDSFDTEDEDLLDDDDLDYDDGLDYDDFDE